MHGGEAAVVLTADDSVCPPIREGEPPTAATMNLRCVLARPRNQPALTGRVLLCQWREADPFAQYAFAADQVAPDAWILLGGDVGVTAKVTGRTISSTGGPPVKVVLAVPAAGIARGAWDHAAGFSEDSLEP